MKKLLWISIITVLAALPYGGPSATANTNSNTKTAASAGSSAGYSDTDYSRSGDNTSTRRWYNPFSWFRPGNAGVETTGTVNR